MKPAGSVRAGAPHGATARPHVRFAARAAHVRSGRRRLTLWGIGVLVLVVATAWLLLLSPVLAARSVQIEGVQGAVGAVLREQAQVPLGTPLLRLDVAAVQSRVLASGVVTHVTVSRSWPSTVVISVSPRTPVLTLKNAQGQLQVVDSTGVAYASVVTPPKGARIVTVDGQGRSTPAVTAMPAETEREGLSTVISLLAVLPKDLRAHVTDLALAPSGDVSFRLGSVRVTWGSGTEATVKARALESLLHHSSGHQRDLVIDVSAPESPVTTGGSA